MIVTGAMLWGATGPLMEWLLSETPLTVPFLLTIRLTVAGVLLLLFLRVGLKKQVSTIWKQKIWLKQLFIFSIFGMLGLQYSFVATIDASNAIVATLLQFLAPIFVVLYVSLSMKKFPPRYQALGILGTLVGLFLLLTNASFDTLLVSRKALIWGVTVGLSFAFYTLYPARLMKEWGVLVVVGWGMFIGGTILGIAIGVWRSDEWVLLKDGTMIILLILLILFGTAAFVLFLSSMKYISPVETSVLSSIEPLTAMLISVLMFGATLGMWQLIGIAVMLVCVTWLSIAGDK
ncbi:putative inner membrane transporter YicL [Metalysinibacillus saudimassiliensis]|uniref:Putative inner membrane transporter YicL n=1 Tax=Metalysinibacillus saudimassiliensis TaxID=1461583 RepID=A0A078M9P9_9BACL|nr:putative inner membrane transporter YicL [Metalysinibacillus saudimassiliensis]